MDSRIDTRAVDCSWPHQRIFSRGWNFLRAAAPSPIVWCFLFVPIAIAVYASGQTALPVPNVETIVARMAMARSDNQARFRAYVVTRDYRLFGKERLKTKFQATADVTFVPPDSKKYVIQNVSGSGLGETVVRRMLASEAEMAKDCVPTDFSPRNYDFRFIREEEVDGQRCYVLQLLPRREEKSLLRGTIWVDSVTYLLHRIEGELAKAPSWWLRDVRIAFLYGSVSGMWLQTALEATATVRILGPYTVVSRDLKYSIGERIAQSSPALIKVHHVSAVGGFATTADPNLK